MMRITEEDFVKKLLDSDCCLVLVLTVEVMQICGDSSDKPGKLRFQGPAIPFFREKQNGIWAHVGCRANSDLNQI